MNIPTFEASNPKQHDRIQGKPGFLHEHICASQSEQLFCDKHQEVEQMDGRRVWFIPQQLLRLFKQEDSRPGMRFRCPSYL